VRHMKPLVADAQSRGLSLDQALLIAAGQSLEVTELLLDAGASVRPAGEWAPLHMAARAEPAEPALSISKLLLARGPDPNADMTFGTPLVLAAQRRHRELVRLPLEAGAEPSCRGRRHLTALESGHAARFGRVHAEAVRTGRCGAARHPRGHARRRHGAAAVVVRGVIDLAT